jgi:hypothetical protein
MQTVLEIAEAINMLGLFLLLKMFVFHCQTVKKFKDRSEIKFANEGGGVGSSDFELKRTKTNDRGGVNSEANAQIRSIIDAIINRQSLINAHQDSNTVSNSCFSFSC